VSGVALQVMPKPPSIAALAIATLVVAWAITLVVVQSPDDEQDPTAEANAAPSIDEEPQDTPEPTPEPPLGGPRTTVEWCIEAPEDEAPFSLGLIEEQARAAIEPHIQEVMDTAIRINAVDPTYRKPKRIELSCPGYPSAYEGSEILVYPNGDELYFEINGHFVDRPGRFSHMVWVLPDGQIEKLFGRKGQRHWPQENQCYGDVCESVSTAFYLSESEIADSQFIRYWLYQYFGLQCHAPPDALPDGFVRDEYCD
jgi:hypothetical protein